MVSSLQQPKIHFYFQHPPASSTYRKRPTNHNKPLKHHGRTANFTGASAAWLDSKPTGGCQGTSTKGICTMLDILINTSCLPRETSSQSWEGVWIIFWSLFYGIMFDSMLCVSLSSVVPFCIAGCWVWACAASERLIADMSEPLVNH